MPTLTKEQDTAPIAPLVLPQVKEIENDFQLVAPIESAETGTDSVDPALDAHAKSITEQLFNMDIANAATVENSKAAVEAMGLDAQRKAAHKSEMLKGPVKTLSTRAEDGGPVANALVDLKMKVEELDPAEFDFEPGWFTRLLGHIPGVGTPLKRYFAKYESSQTILESIKNSLIKGQDQLKRDNITLADDRAELQKINAYIIKAIDIGKRVDLHFSARLDREAKPERVSFFQEEILFPLRQRIMDLQQSVVVNQQGVVAIELISRTNKELIRGVNRAINTTLSALSIAVTVATAVAHQRMVLDKITGVNEVTNRMIANTARNLKQNVAEINKQASSEMLDMATLEQAFVDIRAALEDLSNFRTQALPTMAKTILDLDTMIDKQGEEIEKLEKGAHAAASFSFDEVIAGQ